MNVKDFVVYDLECYSNLFLLVAYQYSDEKILTFEVSSRKDDTTRMMKYLSYLVGNKAVMVGFNNLAYDWPLIDQFIVQSAFKSSEKRLSVILKAMKVHSDKLIDTKVPYFNFIRNPIIKQVDLFRIHHFDNPAKRTSLKVLEFNFKMPNILDLPYHHTSLLTENQVAEVVSYCKNDVMATKMLLDYSLGEIQLRDKMTEIYGMNMLNFNSAKMGEKIISSIVKNETDKQELGKTPRKSIKLKDIILPYVSFEKGPFKAVKKWFSKQVITTTKGVFTEIPFDKMKMLEGMYVEKRKKGTQENLNVVYAGLKWVFGVGGIHASVEGEVIRADDEYMILDIDVSSYYPNLAIANKLFPKHLSDVFCSIYENIYTQRQQHKKGSPMNKALKLALNAVFGKSNSRHSDMYDPKYTMSITVNGQLLLCMLAEGLMKIPDLRILQANTDGMTVYVRREHEYDVLTVCGRWEKLTSLNLEYIRYDLMVIRDVNNYLAVDENRSVKTKGAFLADRELYQNHSMLIVPKALKAYFVDNIPPEVFIPKHKDVYDFFKRTKIPRGMELVIRKYDEEDVVEERELQRVTRYYVAMRGGTLIKIMPPLAKKPGVFREVNLEKSYLVCDCNNLKNKDLPQILKNIDYSYYIGEVRKVIDKIEMS